MLVPGRAWDRVVDRARLLMDLESDIPFGQWLLGAALRGRGLVDASIATRLRKMKLRA